MIEQDIAFIVLAALTVGSAVLSLEARQVVYGAVALAFSFLGVAGLFILLDATFVAMFQIIVYIGAIAVLILFTVMLVTKDVEAEAEREPVKPFAILVAIATGVLVSFIASLSQLQSVSPNYPTGITVADIGELLTNQYALAFEVLALILGASIVGALTLAKVEKE